MEQIFTVLAEIYGRLGGTLSAEELRRREVLPDPLKALLGDGFTLHDLADIRARAPRKRGGGIGPSSEFDPGAGSATPNRRSLGDDPDPT